MLTRAKSSVTKHETRVRGSEIPLMQIMTLANDAATNEHTSIFFRSSTKVYLFSKELHHSEHPNWRQMKGLTLADNKRLFQQ